MLEQMARQAAFAQYCLRNRRADQARLGESLAQRVQASHAARLHPSAIPKKTTVGPERALVSYLELLRWDQFDIDLAEIGDGGSDRRRAG